MPRRRPDSSVYECDSRVDRTTRSAKYPVRRKIENQVAKLAFEHLIVFVDAEPSKGCRIWQWVKRESRKVS